MTNQASPWIKYVWILALFLVGFSYVLTLSLGAIISGGNIDTLLSGGRGQVRVIENNRNIQAPHIGLLFNKESESTMSITPACGNVSTISTVGDSMQPTLFTGNRIIVTTYNPDCVNLREGMIIGYTRDSAGSNSTNVVHRISAVYNDYFLAQGDNTGTSEKVKYENINYVVLGVLYT